LDSACKYEWSFSLGENINDLGFSVQQTYDKGYIIALSTNSYGPGGYDACLMKRDSAGNFMWRKKYGGVDWDFAYDVVQTYDSGYVFCGETYNNSNGLSDVYVVKTNSIGDTLWTRTIGDSLSDKGNAIIQTMDSNLVVTGVKNTTTDSTQIYLIKYNRDGTLMWDSLYGKAHYETGNAVIETLDTGLFIIGGTSSFSPDSTDLNFYVVKTMADGTLMWDSAYVDVNGDNELHGGYELSNGYVFVVGSIETAGAGGKDGSLVLLSDVGKWLNVSPTFGGSKDEVFKSMTIGDNGRMVMVGSIASFGNGLKDMFVVCVDTLFNGQPILSDTVFDATPLRVVGWLNQSDLQIYPNPATNYLKLDVTNFDAGNKWKLELYNVQGRLEKSFDILKKEDSYSLEELSPGFYVYRLKTGNTQMNIGKLVVQ